MQIKTSEGTANAMPLSDIQEYNKKLDENTLEVRKFRHALIFLFVLAIIIVIIAGWYIKDHRIIAYPLDVMRAARC